MKKAILEKIIRTEIKKIMTESTTKNLKFLSYPENEPPDDRSLFLLLGPELTKAVGFYEGDGKFDINTEIGRSRAKADGKLVKYFAV